MSNAAIISEKKPTDKVVDEPLYEVIGGQRVELGPMGAFESSLASIIDQFLGTFVRNHRLGRAVVEMLFLLDPVKDLQRRPDLAFVSYQRWPAKRPVPQASAWEVVPELAVEIISPTNSATEIIEKIRDYFQAGCQRVWVVYPASELVYIYSSPTQVCILNRQDELDGEEVVRGFRLPLRDLFEEGNPSETAGS